MRIELKFEIIEIVPVPCVICRAYVRVCVCALVFKENALRVLGCWVYDLGGWCGGVLAFFLGVFSHA